jgi:predicted nucleotidyltransferase
MAFDTAAAREHLARRNRERTRRLNDLQEQARNDADRIIAMLVEKYRPLRIVQWGSLLRPGGFREWSDIDIAMEGLNDPLDGLRAADDASALTEFPVDIVELDRIDPRHAETILREGKVVYGHH